MNWSTIIGIALWALIPGFIAKKKGRSFWAYYILSFVITPIVTTIITLCLKKASLSTASNNICKTDMSHSETIAKPVQPQPDQSILPEQKPSAGDDSCKPADGVRKIMYCRHCGFRLVDGSEFCSSCGNEIEKEHES